MQRYILLYTCSKMTLRETADGMCGALKTKIKKLRQHVDYMEPQLYAI